jgi:hypothetical protein
MFLRGMCGISHGGGVDNVWGLDIVRVFVIECGLRSRDPERI